MRKSNNPYSRAFRANITPCQGVLKIFLIFLGGREKEGGIIGGLIERGGYPLPSAKG